jgi:hypothetical protein
MIRAVILGVLGGCFTMPPRPADTVDAPAIDDSNLGANYAFVTSQTWAADAIGGRAGADQKCMDAASAGSLGGTTWIAYLSTSDAAATQKLQSRAGWIRPDGKQVAKTMQSLVKGTFFYPISVDENKTLVTDDVPVWTGTGAAGETTSGFLCGDWMLPTGQGTIGHYDAELDRWVDAGSLGCGTPAHLYCIEADKTYDLTPPADPHLPVLFLSANVVLGNTGTFMTDAGAACGTSAMPLVNYGQSAASVSTLGPGFQRPDHVVVHPAGPVLGAPIVVEFDGGFSNVSAYTGGVTYSSTTGPNCSGFSASGGPVIVGSSAESSAQWFDFVTIDCATEERVYCIQTQP